MAFSPYHTTIYSTIDNIKEYEGWLLKEKCDEDNGSGINASWVLELGQDLVEQCKFLEGKLRVKVRLDSHDRNRPKLAATLLTKVILLSIQIADIVKITDKYHSVTGELEELEKKYEELEKKHEELEKNFEILKQENEAHKQEALTLKGIVAEAGAAEGAKESTISGAIIQETNLKNMEPENLIAGGHMEKTNTPIGSHASTSETSPQKRKAETDPADDERSAKKGRA
ncbi:hypothetical protein MMC11_003047 [Xylographa trunciseda]|nr:hypothetical protein [Xylographa trunciseda]